MFVRIRTSTCFCGEDHDEAYEFPDNTTDEELDNFTDELAEERAMDYGTYEEAEEQEIDPDVMGFWEKMEESREEIEEDYGEILKP